MTTNEAIKYLQQLYPNGGHCWLDEQRIEAIGMAIQALRKEPKFNVGDTICNKELTVFIYYISGGKYLVKDVSDTFDFGYLEISEQDEWELVEKYIP